MASPPKDPAARAAVWAFTSLLARDPPGPWTADRYAQVRQYTGVVYVATKALYDALAGAVVTPTADRRDRPGRQQKATPVAGAAPRDQDRTPLPAGHKLSQLLERVNARKDTIGQFLADWWVNKSLTGTAYVYTPMNRFGRPAELWCLPTALVSPQGPAPQYPEGSYRVNWGLSGVPYGWAAGSNAVLDAREVIRDRYFNYLQPSDGYSPLTAGDRQIDLLQAIDQSELNAVNNGLSADAVVAVEGATQEQLDQLSAKFKDRHQGPAGAKVLFTDGTSAKATLLSTTPKEMGYPQGREAMTRHVLALFGVPAKFAGLVEAGSYAEFYAAVLQFYQGTGASIGRHMSAVLTRRVAQPYYGRRFAVAVELPAPRDKEQEAQARDTGLQAGAVTVNEWRVAQNLPPFADGDVPLFEFTARRQQAMEPQPTDPPAGGGGGLGGVASAAPPVDAAAGDDPAGGVADALIQAAGGGGELGPQAKAAGDTFVAGGYSEGQVKTDSRGRKYRVVGGKRVPVGGGGSGPGAGSGRPKRWYQVVDGKRVRVPESEMESPGDTRSTWEGLADGRGRVDADHPLVRSADPAMRRHLPTMARRVSPAVAKRVQSPRWVEQSARRHAPRVAQALGTDEQTAGAVLMHFLEQFAELVSAPFKPIAGAIDAINSDRFQGESWGDTGRRLTGGDSAPRPKNPAGRGSLPPRPRKALGRSAARYADRVLKGLGTGPAVPAR